MQSVLPSFNGFLSGIASPLNDLFMGPSLIESPYERCSRLSGIAFENTTIVDATYIHSATTVKTAGSCGRRVQVSTPVCRVQFFVDTSNRSSVHAEAWLPDEWYGRTLTLGNGGLGGCIDYSNLDYGSRMHFAVVSGDSGHDGDTGAFFLNNPDVFEDFAYRATHTTVILGKQLATAYYAKPLQKSYFLGCSAGGRQSLQTTLMFPDDFDGIVAGAPATDFNHLIGWYGMLSTYIDAANAATSPKFIPREHWDVVTEEILNQCDHLDGIKDRIISDPGACDFRPESLLCAGARDNTPCLTVPQVEALRNIYSPLYGLDGKLIYPRFEPGAEAFNNSQELLSGEFAFYTKTWYENVIYNTTSYDFKDWGLRDIAFSDNMDLERVSTFGGDLTAYKNHGGKFLTYHGTRDEWVPVGNSKRMYDRISRIMGLPTLDSFYRFFIVPGLDHCLGGVGSHMIGQCGRAVPKVNSSSHNALLAIVDWVEGGVAPDILIGTSWHGEERIHCRYPQKSKWNGTDFVCI